MLYCFSAWDKVVWWRKFECFLRFSIVNTEGVRQVSNNKVNKSFCMRRYACSGVFFLLGMIVFFRVLLSL